MSKSGWDITKDLPARLPKVVNKPSDIFTPAAQLIHKRGIKFLIWGGEDTMKTGFGLSCPPPIYLIDTEYGWEHVWEENFPDVELYVFETGILDPNTDEADATKSLDALEKAIAAVRNVKKGTIILDSATDVWFWLQAWMEQTAERRYKKTGEPMRTEWGRVSIRWRQLLLRLSAKKIHFVMTAKPQEIYVSQKSTGMYRPHVQKTTPHMADIVIHAQKQWNSAIPKWEYIAEVTKCRWRKAAGIQVFDITFDKLVNALEKKLGIKIVREVEADE